MIGLILDLLILAAAVLLTGVYTRAYLASDATLSWYARAYAALKLSAVMLVNLAMIVTVAVLDFIEVIANYISSGAGDQIKAAVDPKYTAVILLSFSIIVVIARLRSLWRA